MREEKKEELPEKIGALTVDYSEDHQRHAEIRNENTAIRAWCIAAYFGILTSFALYVHTGNILYCYALALCCCIIPAVGSRQDHIIHRSGAFLRNRNNEWEQSPERSNCNWLTPLTDTILLFITAILPLGYAVVELQNHGKKAEFLSILFFLSVSLLVFTGSVAHQKASYKVSLLFGLLGIGISVGVLFPWLAQLIYPLLF